MTMVAVCRRYDLEVLNLPYSLVHDTVDEVNVHRAQGATLATRITDELRYLLIDSDCEFF